MGVHYQAANIIGICLCWLLILVCLRQFLIIRYRKKGVQIGNGQTIGSREIQCDYFSTVTTVNGVMGVLADGIGRLSGGQLASTIAVKTFIREFEKIDDLSNPSDFFRNAISLSNKEILKNLKGTKGGTTLAAALVSKGYLYWASVGGNVIAVFRNGELIKINVKSNNDIEIGSEPIELEKNDKVILFSDGVYNSLNEVELARILASYLAPNDAAQEIIESINQKKLENQDNATIVILQNFR